MKLVYSGPCKKEFGIVGPVSGTRYAVHPGEPLSVPDDDGQAILGQYPGVFAQAAEPAAPEPKGRKQKNAPAAEPGTNAPELQAEAEEQG